MKVLVLGYGSMGRRHARHARELGHDVAVYDPEVRQDEFAQFVSMAEAGLWHAEAAVVASPARTHVSAAWPFICDIPVLIEKPLAPARSAWREGRYHSCAAVGYNLRFNAGVKALHEALRRFGPVTTAALRVRCDKSSWPGAGYEDMLLEASHELDLATFLLGHADVIGAGCLGPDVWSVLLRHRTGVLTSVVMDGTYDGYDRGAEIWGPRGSLSLRLHGAPVEWRWEVCCRGNEGWSGTCSPEQTYRAELEAFLHGPTGPLCTLGEGLAVLDLCDAARRRAGLVSAGLIG